MSAQKMQVEYAKAYERVSHMLTTQARNLRSLTGPAKLEWIDVAGLYITTGCNVMLRDMGIDGLIAYLRDVADQIERGMPIEE